jgi:hypothetical protein
MLQVIGHNNIVDIYGEDMSLHGRVQKHAMWFIVTALR